MTYFYKAFIELLGNKFVCLFNKERLVFYTNLKTFDSFGRGWTRRVVHNLEVL